jgi:integrase
VIFRYAIATGRPTRDISVDLRGALRTPKVNHRAAITDPGELGTLLRAIEGYSGRLTTRLVLQLSALLFVRPGELRHARWREIDFDKTVWTVSAATMKMKRPHHVPLARQAIVILARAARHHGASRVRVSGRGLSPPLHEQQYAQCCAPSARLRQGGGQRIGFSGDRLDAAQ